MTPGGAGEVVVAVDGGGSKTDAAVVSRVDGGGARPASGSGLLAA